MRSRARSVVSATLGVALVVGTGIPVYAFGDDKSAEAANQAISASLEKASLEDEDLVDLFDIDGDGVLDLLDLDGDGVPDAEDLDHDGIPDPVDEDDKDSDSAKKKESSEGSEDADDEASEGEEAASGAEEASDSEAEGDADENADAEAEDATDADGDVDGDSGEGSTDGVSEEENASADANDEKSDAEADGAKSPKDEKADSKDAAKDEKLKPAAMDKDAADQKEEDKGEKTLVVSGAIDLGESIIKGAKDEQARKLSSELMKSEDEELLSDSVAADISSFLRLPSRSYDYTTAKFIATIGEQARQVAQKNDLYASVLIAQAVIESGNGNSLLAQAPNNNLFGIKGSYKGQSVAMPTQEDDGTGHCYNIVADFRRYSTHAESIADYADLLKSHPGWYKGAYKSNAKTYVDACKALQGVYATSTTYAATLVSVIEGYGLDRYDKPLDFKLSGNVYDPDSMKADKDGYRPATMDDYARLEALATSFIGTDYVWGGSMPSTGFDCSGLVQWCMREALGIELPRVTYTQQLMGKSVRVDADELRMGDLLFFNLPGEGVGHVAMYLGDGFYVHAPETGDVVKVSSIEEFTPSFARRVIEEVNL